MRAIRIAQLERLRQVVVGARFESLSTSSGRLRAVSIRIGTYCPAVRSAAATANPSHPGQHDVEHDGVERRRSSQDRTRAPARRRLAIDDLVAFGFEIEAEAVGDVLLVFDDEDAAHAGTRVMRRAAAARA